MKHKYTIKNKRKMRGGNNEVFDNFTKSMIKLTNALKMLLEKIEKQKGDKSPGNKIPEELKDKIEDQQDEMSKLLDIVNKKKQDINKDNLDESRIALEKEIFFLKEKINKGINEKIFIKNKERDRSFYLEGRTWNDWFYGFIEYYTELKDSLRNIIENSYYNMILKKPVNERNSYDNELIKKVNDLENQLNNLNNNNIVKGGYSKSRYTRKNKI